MKKKGTGRRGIPKYGHHKGSGQAVVYVRGRGIYLGVYGTEESKRRYQRVVDDLLSGVPEASVKGKGLSVAAVCGGFLDRAVQDALSKPALGRVRRVCGLVAARFGDLPCGEFSVSCLRALIADWVASGMARTSVRAYLGTAVQIFRWGVGEGLLDPSVYHALAAVRLARGRAGGRETAPVRPVSLEVVQATTAQAAPWVWRAVWLQVFTGARSGEILGLRAKGVDRSGPVWRAELKNHKGARLGRSRVLYFGARAQAVMDMRDPDGLVIGGADGITQNVYAKRILNAATAAGVEGWSPHRLRHLAATLVRAEFGLEAAQVVLGHATADVTQIYAERDEVKALEVMGRMG